jgi:hypothetical protein
MDDINGQLFNSVQAATDTTTTTTTTTYRCTTT